MAPPPNTAATTALVIASLPFTTTQRADDAGTTYDLWYTLTPATCVALLGIVAYGDATTYQPRVQVYTGPASAPVAYYTDSGNNQPVQVAVVPGTAYFVKLRTNSASATPATLSLSVVAGPNVTAPAGAIAVQDDTSGYPLMLVDAASGAVLRSIAPFPSSEEGDSLPSGVVLVSDPSDATFKLYSPALAFVTAVPWLGVHDAQVRAALGANVFVVADSGTASIAPIVGTIDATGALGATTWTLPVGALNALAADSALAVLYYAQAATFTESTALHRWDLHHATALSDLAPAMTGFRVVDILVLADASVVVGYWKGVGSPRQFTVVRYDPTGPILHTYDLGTDHDVLDPRLGYSVTSGAFWAYTHPTSLGSDYGVLTERRASDGAVLTTLTVPAYSAGAYQPPITTGGAVPFGISPSCPIFPLRVPLSACGGDTPPFGPPSHLSDPQIIRRLRRAPHLSQENKRIFYRTFELDLERGVGLSSGQGEDPLVMLRWSRDGGHTWSEPVTMSAGRIGAYSQRVIARRLGQARDMVFEVTVSDPVAWSLVDAWLDLEAGTS